MFPGIYRAIEPPAIHFPYSTFQEYTGKIDICKHQKLETDTATEIFRRFFIQSMKMVDDARLRARQAAPDLLPPDLD